MAFPLVIGRDSGVANFNTIEMPIPSGVNGDLLLIVFGGPESAVTDDGGFTFTKYDDVNQLLIGWRVADGTEGASVDIGVSSNAQVGLIWRVRDWVAYNEGGIAFGTSLEPNPGTLNPPWGRADALWIATAYSGNEWRPDDFGSYPSGYSQGRYIQISENINGTMAAELEQRDDSQNPSPFILTDGDADEQWIAGTIAIQGIGSDDFPAVGSVMI